MSTNNSYTTKIKERIISIQDEATFNEVALEIFIYQYNQNPVYKRYIDLLKINISSITHVDKIPFLPIDFFKTHRISCFDFDAPHIFTSSGTSGNEFSKHHVYDLQWYESIFTKAFTLNFGAVSSYCHLGLLPSYLERTGSSLLFMVQNMMQQSNNNEAAFYLYNHDELYDTLVQLENQKKPYILWGVTYALLDFIENYTIPIEYGIIMETGGMKGKRKEMIRNELHQHLCTAFSCSEIYSEYGMTELLSQAYSKGNGLFQSPPWMKIITKDLHDPFIQTAFNKTGRINIIDLANIDSCCFIETSDTGKVYKNGTFEINGRMQDAQIRGCNLLVP